MTLQLPAWISIWRFLAHEKKTQLFSMPITISLESYTHPRKQLSPDNARWPATIARSAPSSLPASQPGCNWPLCITWFLLEWSFFALHTYMNTAASAAANSAFQPYFRSVCPQRDRRCKMYNQKGGGWGGARKTAFTFVILSRFVVSYLNTKLRGSKRI